MTSPKKAFDAGDYRTARTLAQQTLDNADASDKAKDGARTILKKTSPPPLAKYIFLLTAVLLVLLSVFWSGESKKHAAPQGSATPHPSESAP